MNTLQTSRTHMNQQVEVEVWTPTNSMNASSSTLTSSFSHSTSVATTEQRLIVFIFNPVATLASVSFCENAAIAIARLQSKRGNLFEFIQPRASGSFRRTPSVHPPQTLKLKVLDFLYVKIWPFAVFCLTGRRLGRATPFGLRVSRRSRVSDILVVSHSMLTRGSFTRMAFDPKYTIEN